MAQENPPKYLWRTPVGRVEFDFNVMLGQVKGLVSDDYLSELSRENEKINKRIRYSYILAMACAFLCYGLASGSSIGVNLPFFSIIDFSLSTSVLVFIMGLIYYNYVINLINSYIISKFMQSITSHISEDTGLIYMSRWDSSNLWIQTLSLRWIGYKSSFWHLIYICVFMIFLAIIFISIILFCNIAAWVGFASTFSDGLASAFISLIGALGVTVSTMYLIMATCMPQRFIIQE